MPKIGWGEIFDISNSFARGEAMELWRELRDRKCLIKSTYIVWFWHTSVVCRCMEAIASMWQLEQSYSATNWQQEVCHFQNALNSPSCFYPICFKLHQNTVKNTADVNTVKGNIDILKYCCHGNVSNLNILFCVILRLSGAFLGGLNIVKNSRKFAHHWNPRQLGRRWGWDPGVAQRLYGAPGNTFRNMMCISPHTCTYSYETRYTYRSYRAEQLLRCNVIL